MERLSPSGHVPLDEETLMGMDPEQRAFWRQFLDKVMRAIEDEQESGAAIPYKFSAEMFAEFQTAITVYNGDRFCQINQIRGIFDCIAPAETH